MRKLLESTRADLTAFIAQERDLLLLAGCGDDDVPILLGLLREIEQNDDDNLYLLFADPFESLERFVELTVERLRAEHCLTDAGLEEGDAPLPPIPEELLDDSGPPLERLHGAVAFVRELLCADPGAVVWVMLPQRIDDQAGYDRLLASFVPRAGRAPAGGLRLILRGGLPAPAHRTRRYPVDLGPAALEDSLEQEVEDEALPTEQRMQALLQLALLDSAHQRDQGAVAKYNFLLGHYQDTGDTAMQAFVLNGLGEIYRREGKLEQAEQWFECAVPPAAESGNAIVLRMVVSNLAGVAYAQQRYARAEELYDGVDQLSAQLLDPEGKARALEQRGLSQRGQRAYDRAVESWESAAQLSRAVGMVEPLRANLGHLEQLFGELGQHRRRAAARAELDAMAREEPR